MTLVSESCFEYRHDNCDGYWYENGQFVGASSKCECLCGHLAEKFRNKERQRILNTTLARLLCDNE